MILYKFLYRGRDPLQLTCINLNLALINYTMRSYEWDEITYPFPNFNGSSVQVQEWLSNFIPEILTGVIYHLYMLGLKLIALAEWDVLQNFFT